MLELFLCSMLTVLPDYLYRRYVQGKRIGREITLFSVFYELRWGITSCVILTVLLITVIFYNHPSTTNANLYFRTVPIITEYNGRVAEVFVGMSERVEAGQPIFRLDDTEQRAAVDAARTKIAEIEARMIVAQADIVAAEGKIQEAESAYNQARDEFDTKSELNRRQSGTVALREIERLEDMVEGRRGAIDAARAARQSAEANVTALLPAQKASAEAQLHQAEVRLEKTVIRAGVTGRVEQFLLRPGDIVSPILRAAGILIPEGAGRRAVVAGFGQIEAQVMKPGMVAEVTCISKPWTVIPMVVSQVQDFIAAGQFRGGEHLVDPQQTRGPGTITVLLEPMFEGGLEGVTPGSSCIANAYTSNHARIAEAGFFHSIALHAVDAVGVVHAALLRLQALILPIRVLVFGGH